MFSSRLRPTGSYKPVPWEHPFALLNKMACPQTENGYTKIANEILEHFIEPGITGSEFRIALFVIRKTYGYNKKKDKISISQFQKSTKMNHKQAVRTIKTLVSKQILLKENGVYTFNKNWEEWVVSKRTPSVQTDTPPVSNRTPKVVSKRTPTKERKKGIQKKGGFAPIGAEIIKAFTLVDPKNKTYYNNTTQRSACDFLLEEFGLDTVLKRISVLPKTNKVPYFPTITSPYELKEKWQKLEDAVERKKGELTKNSRGLEE